MVDADERGAGSEGDALANPIPTSSGPASPGPRVAATADTSPIDTPASPSARRTTPTTDCWCAREAISGTTPPQSACSSCAATTEAATRGRESPTAHASGGPSATSTAAAVSSHEDSRARRT